MQNELKRAPAHNRAGIPERACAPPPSRNGCTTRSPRPAEATPHACRRRCRTRPPHRAGRTAPFSALHLRFQAERQAHARPSVASTRSPARCRGKRRSEEHTSELQSRGHLVCRLLLEKKKEKRKPNSNSSTDNSK